MYVKLTSLPAEDYQHFFLVMNDGKSGNEAVTLMKKLIREIHDQYEVYRSQSISTKQKLENTANIAETFAYQPTS
jgi:hypothetical protein